MIWICATCGVETADSDIAPQDCAICSDERQWVPESGQSWTTLAELARTGTATTWFEVEPGLYGVTATPQVGIGQQTMVVATSAGVVVFDPLGQTVAEWRTGNGGAGVLFAGDAVFPNPDRRTVSFMRSYPNRLPLSGAVVRRIAAQLDGLHYDRLYNNFGARVPTDAKAVVGRSALRHAAWVEGDHDDETW